MKPAPTDTTDTARLISPALLARYTSDSLTLTAGEALHVRAALLSTDTDATSKLTMRELRAMAQSLGEHNRNTGLFAR